MTNTKCVFKFLKFITICVSAILVMHVAGIIKHNMWHRAAKYNTTNYTPVMLADEWKSAKRIIFWNTVFGNSEWGLPKGTVDQNIRCPNNKKCVVSINRNNSLDGDALVFHMRDPYTIPKKRNPHQVYVIYGWESPVYRSEYFVKGAKFYNWSFTYSKKSDISFLHGSWHKLSTKSTDALTNLPQFKKKRPFGTPTIAWVVSNCHAHSHRTNYVKELKRHIAVDVYGKCGKHCPKGTARNNIDCFKRIAQNGQYKFYLAFENSACQDYISLKPYRALESGMLPVVLGGLSADDYIGLFPPNAYLDVRNFTSPKHLAEYLNFLDKNDDKYLAYHAWRMDYSAQVGTELMFWCHLCAGLHNSTMMSTSRNVNWKDFWNPRTKCDGNLVSKLLKKKA